MTNKNTLTIINSFHNDLKIVKEVVYDKCRFELTNPNLHAESSEYGACSFAINGYKIQHRVSKITPTKTGQFVTIWKRNNEGTTQPFDFLDEFDFIVITSKDGKNFGQFVFPKSVLAEKGLITKNGKEGKRGTRVYPPWVTALNKQAEKTQSWQTNYFITIKKGDATDLSLIRKMLTKQR